MSSAASSSSPHVAPVHADEVDRAVAGDAGALGEHGGEEALKLAAAHLARGHRELAVGDLAEAADMAVDADVVGRIGEDELHLLPPLAHSETKQLVIALGLDGIAAVEPVLAHDPEHAGPRDGSRIRIDFRNMIRRVGLPPPGVLAENPLQPLSIDVAAIDDGVDLAHVEAGDLHLEARIGNQEMLQLDLQEVGIPAGILGDAVVGDDVGSLLRFREILDGDRGDGFPAKQLCGLDPAVARQDAGFRINQHRDRKAEGPDALGNLVDLLL